MNVFSCTGNIGNDAETRHTPGGEAVVNFNLAVKSGYGDRAATTWIRCAMWGKRGTAVAEYLTKGQLVGVTGELTNRKYEKDGQEKYSLELRVNDLTLLGKKDAEPQRAQQSSQPRDDFDMSVPF